MPDPFSIWHSSNDKKGGFNFIGYKNKEVDRLIELSQSIIDRKKLDSVFKKIFALIANDNPYIFLYVPSSITVVSKKIKNVTPSIIGVMHNKIEWIKQ
jgi:peptide/nickel transport system substrate-binding protein